MKNQERLEKIMYSLSEFDLDEFYYRKVPDLYYNLKHSQVKEFFKLLERVYFPLDEEIESDISLHETYDNRYAKSIRKRKIRLLYDFEAETLKNDFINELLEIIE